MESMNAEEITVSPMLKPLPYAQGDSSDEECHEACCKSPSILSVNYNEEENELIAAVSKEGSDDVMPVIDDLIEKVETVLLEGLHDDENETLQLALALSKAIVDNAEGTITEGDSETTNNVMALQKQIEKQLVTKEGNGLNQMAVKKEVQLFKPMTTKKDQVNAYANIEASFSLENLVHELESTLSKGHYKEKHIFDKVQMLMEHYDADPDDYQKYAVKLGKDRYTRNLIKKSPYFTLMLLCWPPAICSPIHDHGGSECWLRVCSGGLEERFYNLPEHEDAELKLRFSQQVKRGGVCFINDDQGLHSISNPTDEWAISLHCYVPGYLSCNAYLDEKCASNGKKECQLSFTTVDGVMVE